MIVCWFKEGFLWREPEDYSGCLEAYDIYRSLDDSGKYAFDEARINILCAESS